MFRKYSIIIILFFKFLIYSNDSTTDKDSKNIRENFELKKENNNLFFQISNSIELMINSQGKLMINKKEDIFQPSNNFQLQLNYFFPLNKYIAIGPSLFTQIYSKIFYDIKEDLNEEFVFQFSSVILLGICFRITPYIKKINMPAFLLIIDFGPGVELSNSKEIFPEPFAKFGGFTNQILILPLIPYNIFIMDINIFSIMATYTIYGWFPGIRERNIFIFNFSFFNFIRKKANSGLRIKNIFNFILTGKPDIYDLSSQYTYNRLFVSLYWGTIKGFEINSGYSFEYITFARSPIYYIANKIFYEIIWYKNGFNISFKHTLSFWDQKFITGFPVNEFEVYLSYQFGDKRE